MTGEHIRRALVVVYFCSCTLSTSQLLGTSWRRISSFRFKQVSTGPAGVWAVNSQDEIFYREESYNSDGVYGAAWISVAGNLTQIDVGTNIVWGVSGGGEIFIRTGITKNQPEGCNWLQIPGNLERVSVSKNGHVWGVDSANTVFVRKGASIENPEGDDWLMVAGYNRSMKVVSVGASGVWGVDTSERIYYKEGTFGDVDTNGHQWISVEGSLTDISSGDGEVWGVTNDGGIFARRGITKALPTGDRWERSAGTASQLDVWANTVWDIAADKIFAKKI